MSATVQCINGKQTIEILVGNGIKQTVALKDLQKEGCQAFSKSTACFCLFTIDDDDPNLSRCEALEEAKK